MSLNDRRTALRDRLTDAAGAAIAANGLSGLKARDLARHAGCALGAIYNVFPDLDALVLAVNARTLARLAAALDQVQAPDATPGDALAALARAYLAFAADNENLWRALFEHRLPEGAALPADYLAAQLALFARVESPLGALRPDLDASARAALARTVFSAVHGVTLIGLEEKVGPAPLAALEEQLETLVAALALGLARSP